MANLKEIRIRMASVRSTQQVTGAMKMVSAAKLRKAQDSIIRIRPYAKNLQSIISNLYRSLGQELKTPYSPRENVSRILIIPISSNRGLCGGFNANVIKKTVELTETEYSRAYQEGAVDILAIGKKTADGLKARGIRLIGVNTSVYDKLTYEEVEEFGQSILDSYSNKTYDRVILVYNQFRNAAVQRLVAEQLLPISQEKEPDKNRLSHIVSDYIFEPSLEHVVQTVVPLSLKIQFFKALLDSTASEHGARMTAMHKATDNAASLLKELNLTYNKARQASITNEILEIVSGANALNG